LTLQAASFFKPELEILLVEECVQHLGQDILQPSGRTLVPEDRARPLDLTEQGPVSGEGEDDAVRNT